VRLPSSCEILFPAADEIPPEHRPPPPFHQTDVLINGELRPWEDPRQSVISPIRVCNETGASMLSSSGATPRGDRDGRQHDVPGNGRQIETAIETPDRISSSALFQGLP
jgi:hypothetical protein